jgi:glycosyltransferase involved in cell wall biosynthesis
MSTEASAAALVAVPRAATTARLGWRGGWLGRTAAAFASRYHGWRRGHPALRTAVPAEAAAGRVTVRADAIVIDEVQGQSVAGPVVEAPAAGDPQAVEPTPVIAEPTAERGEEPSGEDPRASVRERLGLGGDDVVVLFAGELDWATGADLAIDAMATVHADAAAVRLVLVGEGPLRAELESRAQHGGFAHACRFLGDLPAEAFAELFAVCDAVTIPARSGQNPMLSEHGLSAAKPVLTTHQAGLSCVRHGENGLVAYDNPGSVVWGLRELGAMVLRARAPAAALAA